MQEVLLLILLPLIQFDLYPVSCHVLRCLSSAGIEPVGNVVMKKAVFTVETISAGMGEVLVYVEDPAGHREEVRPWFCLVR